MSVAPISPAATSVSASGLERLHPTRPQGEHEMLRRSFVVAAMAAVVLWGAQSVAAQEKAGTHEGKVVKAEAGKLTMTDAAGKEHAHTVGADAKVTFDGKECKLEDLKAGTKVKVTTEKKGDKIVVTKVEGSKA
jgi:predicted regulator of Ras-like GTPase activity (Roadblock/LC7/MglB family)